MPVHIVMGDAEKSDVWTIILNLHHSRNVAGEVQALAVAAARDISRELGFVAADPPAPKVREPRGNARLRDAAYSGRRNASSVMM